MKSYLFTLIALLACSCTNNINFIHAEGEISDLIDETLSAQASAQVTPI